MIPDCSSIPRVLLTLCVLSCIAQAPPVPPGAGASEALRLRRTPVVEVFENCKDAVVNISSTQIIKVQSPMGIDSLFEQLFDQPGNGFGGPTREVKRTSVGSGFVIHPAGYIVTNAHVVSRTAERKVVFTDGREYDADLIAIDPDRDLAVLRIKADHALKTLRLGRSSDLMIGESVVAIGNPLGYQNTVTAGVVSAVNRTVQISDQLSFKGLIQTDASINPGSSGGPLLNVLGELIGINTAIRGDAQNIGFAIPVDTLRESLPALIDAEHRYRIVTGLRLSGAESAKVVSVEKGSPADAAGIAPGDVVTAVNKAAVANDIDFNLALIEHQRGDALRINMLRGGKAMETTLTLGGRARPDGSMLLGQRFGLKVEPMSEKMARAMGLRRVEGLLVTAVEPDSPAQRVGVQRGDVIDHLAGVPANNLDDIGTVLERTKSDKVAISVFRIKGRSLYRMQGEIPAR